MSNEAFCVIRDAIRDKGMAGIARIVLARRERMILLEPLDEGLVGTTLHAADEVRDEDKVFDEISEVKYPKEMKELAVHIIESKAAHFDPKQFDDRYEEAVAELLKSKQAGKPMKDEPSEKASNVVNLMDALKRSVSAEKAGSVNKKAVPAKKPAAKSKPAKKPAAKAKARKAG
ncbi:MAG: Ku protein [Microvirga sp.]|nr:Ku protein [Microvirga sp.]